MSSCFEEHCSLGGEISAIYYLCAVEVHVDGLFVSLQLQSSPASNQHTPCITVVLKHTYKIQFKLVIKQYYPSLKLLNVLLCQPVPHYVSLLLSARGLSQNSWKK